MSDFTRLHAAGRTGQVASDARVGAPKAIRRAQVIKHVRVMIPVEVL